jgi:hypothetical protein
MQVWEERPREIAALFNPAFCAVLLRETTRGYHREANQGMPYPLVLLVLPIVLHKATRENLPGTTRTRLHVWLQNNPAARINFASRVRQFIPYTREALIFGIQHRVLITDDDGAFIHGQRRLSTLNWAEDSEPEECRKQAGFVGRWFAQAGEATTIFAMWGIRP